MQENKMLIEEIEQLKSNYPRELASAQEKLQQEMMQLQNKNQDSTKVTKNKKKYDNQNDYAGYDENGNTRDDLDYYLNRSLSEVSQNQREDKHIKQIITPKPPLKQLKNRE